MRDLPPQVLTPALDLPAVAPLELPAVVVALAPTAPERSPIALDTGPPPDTRLRAAPVGIVRILS
ncbi:MAG: hypothetical protein O2894_05425 [Planctomycetota bacterium]|nr:hypothetical protein [Planctomycetota bacterium]